MENPWGAGRKKVDRPERPELSEVFGDGALGGPGAQAMHFGFPNLKKKRTRLASFPIHSMYAYIH